MTRDEVLAMKPGRELDALVAEKVMLWRKRLYKGFEYWDGEGNKPLVDNWSPSTDIAAAWEVVKKMSEEWPQFSIVRVDTGWCVMWGFDGYGWPDVTAATAPEAICKAALLAVMDGEDEHERD